MSIVNVNLMLNYWSNLLFIKIEDAKRKNLCSTLDHDDAGADSFRIGSGSAADGVIVAHLSEHDPAKNDRTREGVRESGGDFW